MKFTDEDKKYLLLHFGETEENIKQIEEATTTSIFEMNCQKIGIKKTIELLGRKKFLAAMDRAAFHFSATAVTNNNDVIYVDNSKMLKKI